MGDKLFKVTPQPDGSVIIEEIGEVEYYADNGEAPDDDYRDPSLDGSYYG